MGVFRGAETVAFASLVFTEKYFLWSFQGFIPFLGVVNNFLESILSAVNAKINDSPEKKCQNEKGNLN